MEMAIEIIDQTTTMETGDNPITQEEKEINIMETVVEIGHINLEEIGIQIGTVIEIAIVIAHTIDFQWIDLFQMTMAWIGTPQEDQAIVIEIETEFRIEMEDIHLTCILWAIYHHTIMVSLYFNWVPNIASFILTMQYFYC